VTNADCWWCLYRGLVSQRACVQDEVRIISHLCHQCQLPGIIQGTQHAAATDWTDSRRAGGWASGTTDACINSLGYMLDVEHAGQCCNTVFLAYMLCKMRTSACTEIPPPPCPLLSAFRLTPPPPPVRTSFMDDPLRTVHVYTVPNLVTISQIPAELLWFSVFQNGGRPPSWILV